MKFGDLKFNMSEYNGQYCRRARKFLKNNYSVDILAEVDGFNVFIKNCDDEVIGAYFFKEQSKVVEKIAWAESRMKEDRKERGGINYWIKLRTGTKIFYETREQWLDAIDAEAFKEGKLPSVFFEIASESDDYYDEIFYQEVGQDEDGFYSVDGNAKVYKTKEEAIEDNKPSRFINEM